jgi:hypothetical protein
MQIGEGMAKRIAIVTCGLSVFIVGAITLLGYYIDYPKMYVWSKDTVPMAISTAVCMVLIGWALFTIGFKKDGE